MKKLNIIMISVFLILLLLQSNITLSIEKDVTSNSNVPKLLQPYETGDKKFKEVEINDKLIYFYQRKIDNAIVENDQIVYQFDKNTKNLLTKKIKWRNDLPLKLPKIKITKEQAESMVKGSIESVDIYIISPESIVFPIKPTPKNPCWIVRSINNDLMEITIIDAITGKILGYGVPPPYNAFSFTGPTAYTPSCSGGWDVFYQNAESWFNTMGYDTEAIKWPTEAKVQSHIQSQDTALFYEIAHGGSTYFANGCVNGNSYEKTYASEIETWISNYKKIPFSFIASCDGMCNVNDNTLSYELRKGSTKDTVTVGYCGMSKTNCVSSCWSQSYYWQDDFFNYANQGHTLKEAFDQANANYPNCAIGNCMRFAGDENFVLNPVVKREPIPPYKGSSPIFMKVITVDTELGT